MVKPRLWAGGGGDPELEAAEAANAAPAAEEEEEDDEFKAGDIAAKRRMEIAAKRGRLNFQAKVDPKVSPPQRWL